MPSFLCFSASFRTQQLTPNLSFFNSFFLVTKEKGMLDISLSQLNKIAILPTINCVEESSLSFASAAKYSVAAGFIDCCSS